MYGNTWRGDNSLGVTMSHKETYIKRYEAARTELREILELAQGNPTIYEPWRMKEVLDHITGWDDAVIASIGPGSMDSICSEYSFANDAIEWSASASTPTAKMTIAGMLSGRCTLQ